MPTRLRLLETVTVLAVGLFVAVIVGKAAVSFQGRPVMFLLLATICFTTVGSQVLYGLAGCERFKGWGESGGVILTFLCLFDAVVALSYPINPVAKFVVAAAMLVACPVLSWVAERSVIREPDCDAERHRRRFEEA